MTSHIGMKSGHRVHSHVGSSLATRATRTSVRHLHGKTQRFMDITPMNPIERCVRCHSSGEPAEKARDVENRKAGRSTYRPSSYTELIDDAVASIVFGIEDGLKRMEVEFPAVSNVDGYKGSSDLYIDSNIQLAIAAARKIYSTTALKVHILLPDDAEYRRAYKLCVLVVLW